MKNKVLASAALVSLFLLATPAAVVAQNIPVPPGDPVALRTGFGAQAYSGTVLVSLSGETTGSTAAYSSNQTWSPFGTQAFSTMKPGQNYTLTVQAFGNTPSSANARVYFNPPPGYVVMVEDVESLLYKVVDGVGNYINFPPGYPGAIVSLEVRLETAPGSGTFLPAGASSSLRSGKVMWEVGMGALKNGKPAGAIALRSDAITANTYTPAGLIFASESTEIDVIHDANGLRQVFAPKALADIQYSGGRGYSIYFYERWRVTTKDGNGNWQVNDPNGWFSKYEISDAGDSGYNYLKIIKTVRLSGDTAWETKLYAPSGGTTWTLEDWHKQGQNVLRKETHTFTSNNTVELVTVKDNASAEATTYQLTYAIKPWGKELIKRIDGINPSNPGASPTTVYPKLTTEYYYHESAGQPGNYGKVKAIKYPDGSWVRYDYYDDDARLGLPFHKYEPYLDLAPDPLATDTSKMRITTYDYTYDYTKVRKSLPASEVVTQPDGENNPGARVTAGKRITTYPTDDAAEYHVALGVTQKVRKETITDYASASSGVTTIVKRFREDSDISSHFTPGLIYSRQKPDGTLEAHAYFKGTWYAPYWGFHFDASGTLVAEFIFRGVPGSGLTYISQSGQDFDLEDITLIPGKSTVTMLVRDETGAVQWSDERVWDGSGYNLTSDFPMLRGSRVYYNALGQQQKVYDVYRSNGAYGVNYVTRKSLTVAGGEITSSTDASGVVTNFVRDARGRLQTSTVVGVSQATGKGNAQPDVVTTYEYDADDRVLATRVGPISGARNDTTYTFDRAGRLTDIVAEGPASNNLTTTIRFSSDNRTVTTTAPGAAPVVVRRYLDGRQYYVADAVGGKGTYNAYYGLGAGVQRIAVTKRVSESGAQADYRDSDYDWLGRVTQSSQASVGYGVTNSYVAYRKFTYLATGQLGKVEQYTTASPTPTAPPYVYEYDQVGKIAREGFDIDGNGLADPVTTPSTSDMVVSHDWAIQYATLEGTTAWWLENASYRYPSGATAVLNGRNWTQLSHLTSSVASRVVQENASGVVGRSEIWTDRYGKTVTQKAYQTGVSNPAQTLIYNGRLSIETAPSGETATSTYDAYGRLTQVSGRDSVKVTYAYDGATNFLQTVGNAVTSSLVTYTYDAAGRVILETLADGGTRRRAYDSDGRLDRQWGTAIDPVLYEFDTFGRLEKITTYRDDDGFTDSGTWPTSSALSNPQTTSFTYDNMSGKVTKKTYPNNSTDTYSYGYAGNLYKLVRS
ncbi:MAG: RHS repeat protein, partial [Verrucomicrobia bacterium]